MQHAGGRYAHRNCGLREHDGLPRGPGPRCSPAVAADERDGGRGTLDRTAARLPFRAIADWTSSSLRSAVAAILACRAACSRLAHPALRRRRQACRARPHPVVGSSGTGAPRQLSIAVSTVLRQSAGGGARSPETGPRDLRSVRTMRPIRLPTACARQPGTTRRVSARG